MADVLQGPRLKILRAKHGLQELNDELVAFGKTDPYEFVAYEDLQAREQIFQVRVNQEPPPTLGIVVGEVVHNLRSALDHIACVLPLVRGARRPTKPQFPVFDLRDPDPAQPNRRAFIRHYKGRVGDIIPRAYDFIESIQPYHPTSDPAGWHPLAMLEDLWNHDKHNAIHIVTANFGAINIPQGIPEGAIAPAGPVHDCQVLAHWPLEGLIITNDSPDPLPNIGFAIQPAFGDGGPASGHALFPTLTRIYEYINREVVGPLERIIYEAR